MKKIKITASVLTYNEEKRIGNVLESLKDFDEIIVWDKSSTDKTREIAISYGAKIFQSEYYNDTPPCEVRRKYAEALYAIQDSEWIFCLVASDVIHHGLYNEMVKAINQVEENCEAIEIPIYRYSMGVVGRNSYFGDMDYEIRLITRELAANKADEDIRVHENIYQTEKKYKMRCLDSRIAVYHLTHESLDLVMDRHWRYSVQYVEDWTKSGKTRDKIMKYAWHECIRTVRTFFKRRMYKLGEVGMAQMMMIVMYNAMIYLNAFFSTEREQQISDKYKEIRKECNGKESYTERL